MATPEWDALIERLHDPDPKARRRAVRKLAATRDPAVLPFLRNVYLQEEDERVRQAARDALAMFKAMEEGRRPSSPMRNNTLSRVLTALAVLFVLSLLLNGVLAVAGGRGDDDEGGTPGDRDVLTGALGERLAQAREDIDNLRSEIDHQNSTDEVICEAIYHRPEPYPLAAADRRAYPDLVPVADGLEDALVALREPQATWDTLCAQETASLTQGLEALKQLDRVSAALDEVSAALDEAIREPMPTPGPSPTPIPTITNTPAPTDSPVPGAPTDIPTTPTAPPVTESTAAPATLTPTPTLTLTPTITPTPTQTPLPYPDLNYPEILRQLSERLIVLGDLQNSYETGMIDYWQQAQEGKPVSTTFCTLPAWPTYFFWNDAQRAELARPDAADPELEEAVRLINEGLDRALPARAMFEPSCQSQTLAATADDGIPLASEAFAMISEAQTLIEQIRRRP